MDYEVVASRSRDALIGLAPGFCCPIHVRDIPLTYDLYAERLADRPDLTPGKKIGQFELRRATGGVVEMVFTEDIHPPERELTDAEKDEISKLYYPDSRQRRNEIQREIDADVEIERKGLIEHFRKVIEIYFRRLTDFGIVPVVKKLSYEAVVNIVETQLDCLDKKIYEVKHEYRTLSTLSTVTIKKSGELLGCYRVNKEPDGGGSYRAIQGNSVAWDLVWDTMLNRTLQRADGTMTEAMEQDYQQRQGFYHKQIQEHKAKQVENPATVEAAQPLNTIADTQGGTITYKRNEQGQTVITGGTVNPGYYAELGQGVAIKPERADYEAKTDSVLLRHNDAGKPEKKTVENTRIPTGKYDDLCISWVKRPEIPKQRVEEFLSERAPELTKRTFYRVVLQDVYERGLINKKGRTYVPKD